jgi:hypothetical protein
MTTRKSIHLAIAEFIEEQGHQTKLSTSDADCRIHSIEFKSKGLRYQVSMSEEDPGFFSVALTYMLPDRAPALGVLLQIAHDVGAAQKATKIEVLGARMIATVEQYFEGEDGFKSIFWRCVNALKSSSQLFFRKLEEAMPSPDPELEAREAAERFLTALSKPSQS